MSSSKTSGESGAAAPPAPGEMKLEVVTLPVSDADRAKDFYEGLGWRLDADLALGDDTRVVQFTPPGSACSFAFGNGLTKAEPGSAERFELAVADIEATREDLISRGVEVGEPFHLEDAEFLPGLDPERRSYLSYASFSDPDGNGWLIREITERQSV
jgi:catechol 2,3-dioxygenase-like lactoylglutathione lyase family enzyme